MFWVVFLALVFFDGALVAFSNVVDIGNGLFSITIIFPRLCLPDCGGTSILAKQHGFTVMHSIVIIENNRLIVLMWVQVDDATLNRFNSLHTGWFDAAMIVISPIMAYVGVLAADKAKQYHASSDNTVGISLISLLLLHLMLTCLSPGLLCVLAVVFLVSSLLSLFYYLHYIPNTSPASTGNSDADAAKPHRTCCDEFEDIASNVWAGFKLCTLPFICCGSVLKC